MKKLFLKGYRFNIYLFLNEMKKEIIKRGGEMVESYPYILKEEKIKIYNSTFLQEKQETEEKAEIIAKNEKAAAYYQKYYKNYYNALKRNYKYIKIVKNTSYLQFYYEGYIYYIQFDENPYFDHFILKQKAEKIEDSYIVKYAYYMDKVDLPGFDVYAFINQKTSKKYQKNILTI